MSDKTEKVTVKNWATKKQFSVKDFEVAIENVELSDEQLEKLKSTASKSEFMEVLKELVVTGAKVALEKASKK